MQSGKMAKAKVDGKMAEEETKPKEALKEPLQKKEEADAARKEPLHKEESETMNEEYGIVLDYLPRGKSSSYKSEPVAQIMGEKHFTLLEIVPKADLKTGERIYIGREERDKVDHIKKRITYAELTSNSLSEIEKAISELIEGNRQRFVDFFNTAGAITLRRHQLELLPGLGKKHLFNILDERQKKPFESFEDLGKRVHLMPNVTHTIARRIIEELEGEDEKHYLFARPPARKHEFRPRGFGRREMP